MYLASLMVRWRTRIGELNASESISSVAVANTFPARTSSPHCASASPGACEHAIPDGRNGRANTGWGYPT